MAAKKKNNRRPTRVRRTSSPQVSPAFVTPMAAATPCGPGLPPEPFCPLCDGLCPLHLPVFGWRHGDERAYQEPSCIIDLLNSTVESCLVDLGRVVEAAQLPNELQSGRPNLFVSSRGLKVKQGLNIAAHKHLAH